MKLNNDILLELINNSFINDSIRIKDHRGNLIELNKGNFIVNEVVNTKDRTSIISILTEAAKLSRYIKINEVEYVRLRNKWKNIEDVDPKDL